MSAEEEHLLELRHRIEALERELARIANRLLDTRNRLTEVELWTPPFAPTDRVPAVDRHPPADA